ncbi:uncharacterized protein LOC107884021 isoform X4 [Acyrthosiphon pisum]|uniref:Uncharacterized protein n=1 Tax=Acyrthosiphon pisum TaxID=7029 RepID=A0A8R2JR32_ACYPI|nr:uncharacterized protein LOC107884021 isoform X4 [Acyrthosiphon pisum]
MISYKVLITLTVIFIINCSVSPRLEDYNNCETNLMEVGFSNEFGYLNYCFAKQFDNNMLKAFFKDSMSYLNAGDDLNNPEMYCFKNMNTMHVCDYVNCFKQKNVQFDDPGKSTNSIQYF